MNISMDINQTTKIIKNAKKQINYATSKTINDLLFGIKERSLKQFESIFDKPNMNFLKGSFIIKKASKAQLVGSIGISDSKKGKGASPLDVLGHQINSAKRGNRRCENLMKRQGLMGSSMYALPSRSAGSGVIDQYGGISGKFSSWIISYLRLYDKAGFTANMTDKKRNRVHKIGKSKSGYKKINGVIYFLSAGKEGFGGQRSHLQAGIWKKTGTHGSDVEPVILFFNSKSSYKKRFFFEEIAKGYVNKNAPTLLRKNLDQAFRTAK